MTLLPWRAYWGKGGRSERICGRYEAGDSGTDPEKLSDGIEKAFPETPDTTLEVKYVPKEMEEHLSPAFYMIPAIDNSRKM